MVDEVADLHAALSLETGVRGRPAGSTWSAPAIVVRCTLGQSPWRAIASSSEPYTSRTSSSSPAWTIAIGTVT